MKKEILVAQLIGFAIVLGIAGMNQAEAGNARTSTTKWTDLPGYYSAAKICDGKNLVYISYESIAVAQNDIQCGGSNA